MSRNTGACIILSKNHLNCVAGGGWVNDETTIENSFKELCIAPAIGIDRLAINNDRKYSLTWDNCCLQTRNLVSLKQAFVIIQFVNVNKQVFFFFNNKCWKQFRYTFYTLTYTLKQQKKKSHFKVTHWYLDKNGGWTSFMLTLRWKVTEHIWDLASFFCWRPITLTLLFSKLLNI